MRNQDLILISILNKNDNVQIWVGKVKLLDILFLYIIIILTLGLIFMKIYVIAPYKFYEILVYRKLGVIRQVSGWRHGWRKLQSMYIGKLIINDQVCIGIPQTCKKHKCCCKSLSDWNMICLCNPIYIIDPYTLSNVGSLKRTLQYNHYSTPGEPCRGCIVIVLKGSF